MGCCHHCEDAGWMFDRKTAEKELRKYRKKGLPYKSARLLIDALGEVDLREKTLLDIGGGVGMIQHELLERGLSRSLLVEASPAYLDVAEGEAARRGHAGRTAFRYGDFVELAPELPAADLVTLHRVICCYPHMRRLVEASTEKARRWYAAVYPRERWYNRLGTRLVNTYCRFRSVDFRLFVHRAVDEAIRAQGFSPIYQASTIVWDVMVYRRERT